MPGYVPQPGRHLGQLRQMSGLPGEETPATRNDPEVAARPPLPSPRVGVTAEELRGPGRGEEGSAETPAFRWGLVQALPAADLGLPAGTCRASPGRWDSVGARCPAPGAPALLRRSVYGRFGAQPLTRALHRVSEATARVSCVWFAPLQVLWKDTYHKQIVCTFTEMAVETTSVILCTGMKK
ncbi:hypothetical protein TREES_T100003883 [Tupaia chinensis]|uniref:Uncharacterized protein n=1 Tax=Tupaia chinensis TaxID=246437 RepID=L9KYV0_TUPCH|nr:hypothetical protein TREES_T100003883 [Tupaia chinensis]